MARGCRWWTTSRSGSRYSAAEEISRLGAGDRGGQRQVRVAGGEFGQAAVPGALAELKGRLGVPAAEGTDQQRQHRLAEGVLEGHGDPAAHHFRFVPDQVQPGLEFAQRGLDVRQERLRGGGQPHAAAVTDQQFRPDDAAGPRDARLTVDCGSAQQVGGRGDVLGAPELSQQRQQRQQLHQVFVLDVHGPPSNSFRICYEFYENHALEACSAEA